MDGGIWESVQFPTRLNTLVGCGCLGSWTLQRLLWRMESDGTIRRQTVLQCSDCGDERVL